MERFVFSTTEAAEYIGVGVNKIRALWSEGKIKAVRSGKNWKIPRPMLERYILECAEKGEEI